MIKICGLTHIDDVAAAVEGGASAVGFVQAPDSPRYVATLAPLFDAAGSVPKVAVFRTYAGEPVSGFDYVQAFVYAVPSPLPVLQAYRDHASVADDLVAHPGPLGDALLDGPGGGGKGVPADWDRAETLARRLRLVLAGGLHPNNVADAIRKVRPYGVDVSSGIERIPGRKDPQKIYAFIQSARRTLETSC